MKSKKRNIGKFISHTKAIVTWSTAVAISIWIAALIVIIWSHWTSTKTLLIIATKTIITAPVTTSTTLISWITLITLRWIWIIISRPILIPSLTSTFLFSITQYNKINHFNVSWAFDFFFCYLILIPIIVYFCNRLLLPSMQKSDIEMKIEISNNICTY